MDNLLAGKLTSRWEANLPRDVQRRSPLNACGKHSAEAGILIGFAPES